MCVRLANENMDICEKHLSAAVARLSEDSETVLAKLVARCGKDSAIPLIMAIDSLTAGIDTTGHTDTGAYERAYLLEIYQIRMYILQDPVPHFSCTTLPPTQTKLSSCTRRSAPPLDPGAT